MATTRYYHPEYRQAEVSAIVAALDRGQSVSVIGPPSVGKTNLLRYLDQERLSATDPTSPWLRYAPLSREQGSIVTINIDPNALLPSLPHETGEIAASAWPGFELLIHRTTIKTQLYPTVRARGEANAELAEEIERLQTRFNSAHPDVSDFEDRLHAHLALRHLESLLDSALSSRRLQNAPIRIAYFMDEFERFLQTMPNYFFVALRSIRDRFKYEVMFVTFTRNSLPYLAGNRVQVLEPFLELFHDNAVYLHPFVDDDAWRMIEQLEEKSVSQDDYALGLLIRSTGGFAGLLRAGFKHVDKLAHLHGSDYHHAIDLAANRLSAETNVQAECETLLRGLNSVEIETLFGVMNRKTELDPHTIRELLNKSLLRQDSSPAGVCVVPPVLAAYIRNHPSPPKPRPPAPPATLPEN